jgi:hypothetical protein
MNAASVLPTIRLAAALGAVLIAGSAHAGYRCAEPETEIDRRACAAARQGPDELRQFVQRMNWLRHNLQFSDYVDEKTQLAWDQQRARPVAAAASAVASARLPR